jgi:hypothetical protein
MFAALLLFALPAAAQYNLTMNMTNFTPTHENQLFKLRVVKTSDGSELAEFVLERIVNGDFSTKFNNILQAGETYNIDAFADFNNNMLYDAPPVDHAWRIVLSGVASDTTIELRHTPTWTDIQYPNPGSGGENPDTEPPVICSCDLNADGNTDIMDLLEWIIQVKAGTDNVCLDYNKDGKLAISDLVSLMISIRNGGCM